MTPLMCLRLVAPTLNQSGAGFGSWLARDTLTDSTESCGGAFCMQLDVWGIQGLHPQGYPRHAALSVVALASASLRPSVT